MNKTQQSEKSNRGWYPITADGRIVNNSSLNLIPSTIKPALLAMAQEIIGCNGENISVYLRGSAARGTFISGVSDIDVTVIFQNEKTGVAVRHLLKRIEDVVQGYPFGDELDLIIVPENILREGGNHNKLRFLMEIQGLNLAGPKLVGLHPDPNLATCHYEIETLKNTVSKFENVMVTSDNATTLKSCQKIMKVMLRAGFELVMARENKYTRELSDCLKGFAAHYPKRATDMKEALGLVVKPTLYSHHLQFLTRSLNRFILAESARLKK